jgi:hypothetical protein
MQKTTDSSSASDATIHHSSTIKLELPFPLNMP